jgi:hypothetical protein
MTEILLHRVRLEIPVCRKIPTKSFGTGTGTAMEYVTNEPKVRRTKMTQAITATKSTKPTHTPMTREEVKRMLRDAAFVLQMTRRVKAEMIAERPETAKSTVRKTPELAAGLGV